MTDVIDWNWFWVFSPLISGYGLATVFFLPILWISVQAGGMRFAIYLLG